jgi:hypothetical protein
MSNESRKIGSGIEVQTGLLGMTIAFFVACLFFLTLLIKIIKMG